LSEIGHHLLSILEAQTFCQIPALHILLLTLRYQRKEKIFWDWIYQSDLVGQYSRKVLLNMNVCSSNCEAGHHFRKIYSKS